MNSVYFVWPDDSCGCLHGDGVAVPAGATEITAAQYQAGLDQAEADMEQERADRDAARQAAEAGAQAERDADYADLVAQGISPATAARLTGGGP